MPLYEFRCAKCGHVFEELVMAGAAGRERLQCPACASARVKKVLSTFATGGMAADAPPCGGGGGACGSGGFT